MISQLTNSTARASWVSATAPLALVVLSGFVMAAGLWKLLVIGWVSFAAMAGCAAIGTRVPESATRLAWGYGLTSGAMIASAAAFLVPQAIGYEPRIGGFGIAAGIIGGYGAHTIGHRLSHLDLPFDDAVVRLTVHALAAGLVIGVAYATIPGLGLLLGLAIVSHKGPAGYAAARQLARAGKPVFALLFPAAAVGVPAMLVGLLGLSMSTVANAAVFGFAAGMFLHVATDFLPRCEVSEVAYDGSRDAHTLLNRLRLHAVASTALGGIFIFAAWAVLAM